MVIARTISGMVGKGSVSHNTRAFTAANVDAERSVENIAFVNEDIEEVYHRLFDDALERYNAKQKRNDRKIDNYYEKIRVGKQEKLFHEVIFQIGNRDDMNARSPEGQLAKEILQEFMEDFQKRNPSLYVFSAHLHMDEETPHVHIDFVPFIKDSKRGLDTRVSLKGALGVLGFTGGTRSETETNQWISAEKEVLAEIMERHDVQWLQKGTHEKHLSVLDFQKQERLKEVEALEQEKKKQLADNQTLQMQQKRLQKEMESMVKSKEELEKNIHAYDEDEKWQLPEAGALQTAKSYREKSAEPLVVKLKDVVKNLTIRCVQLTAQVKQLNERCKNLSEKVKHYKKVIDDKTVYISQLEQKAEELESIKQYVGADKVKEMVDSFWKSEMMQTWQKKALQKEEKVIR